MSPTSHRISINEAPHTSKNKASNLPFIYSHLQRDYASELSDNYKTTKHFTGGRVMLNEQSSANIQEFIKDKVIEEPSNHKAD